MLSLPIFLEGRIPGLSGELRADSQRLVGNRRETLEDGTPQSVGSIAQCTAHRITGTKEILLAGPSTVAAGPCTRTISPSDATVLFAIGGTSNESEAPAGTSDHKKNPFAVS